MCTIRDIGVVYNVIACVVDIIVEVVSTRWSILMLGMVERDWGFVLRRCEAIWRPYGLSRCCYWWYWSCGGLRCDSAMVIGWRRGVLMIHFVFLRKQKIGIMWEIIWSIFTHSLKLCGWNGLLDPTWFVLSKIVDALQLIIFVLEFLIVLTDLWGFDEGYLLVTIVMQKVNLRDQAGWAVWGGKGSCFKKSTLFFLHKNKIYNVEMQMILIQVELDSDDNDERGGWQLSRLGEKNENFALHLLNFASLLLMVLQHTFAIFLSFAHLHQLLS